MLRLALAATLLAAPLAAPAFAQEIHDCDWRASAQAQIEPWEDFTRTFSNGAVRVALLDVIEPAAGSYYLLVLSPPRDELGSRVCKVIGMGGGMGYAGLDFQSMDAAYDPATGLQLTVPGTVYDPNTAQFVDGLAVIVTINQATGQITARHQ